MINAGKIQPPARGLYYGAFLGDGAPTRARLESHAASAQKRPAVVMWFHGFAAGFDFPSAACSQVRDAGAIPFIKLEPWSWRGKEDNSFSLRRIISGEFDSRLNTFAAGLKLYGSPVLLSFGHEMNAPFDNRWYPWAGIPGEYQEAFRHVWGVFHENRAANAGWVYNVNEYDASLIPQYYPGNEYVDWLAVDGYNFGATQSWSRWRTFDDIFRGPYEALCRLSPDKPVMIAETSSTETGGSKAVWTREMAASVERFPRLKALVWFDLEKETDWRIGSSPESAQAFRQAVAANPLFLGA